MAQRLSYGPTPTGIWYILKGTVHAQQVNLTGAALNPQPEREVMIQPRANTQFTYRDKLASGDSGVRSLESSFCVPVFPFLCR